MTSESFNNLPVSKLSSDDNTSETDRLLGQVASEFFERVAKGEQPSINEYCDRYPQIADLIRETFAAVSFIEESLSGHPIDPSSHPSRNTSIGDFRIIREIGRGGMGVVYEAEQLSIGGRRIALKVLPFAAMADPRRLQRFHNEVRAAASLDHPNIVSIYSVGEDRGVHFYAMRLIHGQSMATLIRELTRLRNNLPLHADSLKEILSESSLNQGGNSQSADSEENAASKPSEVRLPHSTNTEKEEFGEQPHVLVSTKSSSRPSGYVQAVVDLAIQAADALEHAHQRGVVHRDIKPANLLVDAYSQLYITDFGLAHIEEGVGLTMTGELVGTLRYMSPEQAMGTEAVVDYRTDIYSLGVSIYELLTTRPAFAEANRAELLRQIADAEPRRLRQIDSTIPRDLETIVHKSMAKSPGDRYASAQELANDLRAFRQHQPISARPPSAIDRARKWASRNQGLVTAVMVISIVIAIASTISSYLLRQETLRVTQQSRRATIAEGEAKNAEARANQQALRAERAAVTTQGINRFLIDYVLAKADPTRKEFSSAGKDFREALNDAARYVDTQFPDEPEQREWLYRAVGQLFAKLGQFEQSRDAYTKSIDLLNSLKDSDEIRSRQVEAMLGLGRAQKELGQLDQSVEILRQSLDNVRMLVPVQSDLQIAVMLELADTLRERHDLDEARELSDECWEMSRKTLGEEDPRTAQAAVSLANSLVAAGDYQDAENLLLPATEIMRTRLGLENLDTQRAIHDYADLKSKLGQPDVAERLLREILQSRIQVQGATHRLTQETLFELSVALADQKKLSESEALLRDLIRGRQFQPNDSDGSRALVRARTMLSKVLWLQGKVTESASTFTTQGLLEAPLEKVEDFNASFQYSDALLGLGNFADAAVLMARVVEKAAEDIGGSHPVTGQAVSRLLVALYCADRPIEADEVAGTYLGALLAIGDDNSGWVAEAIALKSIVDGKPQKYAEELLTISLQEKRQSLPAEHLSIAATLAFFARARLMDDRADDAFSLISESLEIRKRSLPAEHWLIAETLSIQGECLTRMGRYTDAEPLVVDAYQQIADLEELSPAQKLKFLERVVELYSRSEQRERVAHWLPALADLESQCLAAWKELSAELEPFYLNAASRHGKTLGDLGRLDEAEQVLLETCARVTTTQAWHTDAYLATNTLATATRARLAEVYKKKGDMESFRLWSTLLENSPAPGDRATTECHLIGIEAWTHVCKQHQEAIFKMRLARAYADAANAYLWQDDLQSSFANLANADQILFPLREEQANNASQLSCQVLDSLSEVAFLLGKYVQAREALESVVSIASQPANLSGENAARMSQLALQARVNLALYFVECADESQANPRRAIQLAADYPDLTTNRLMNVVLGLAHLRIGESARTIELLQQTRPGDIAWFVLAMAHQEQGDRETARFHYDTASGFYWKDRLDQEPTVIPSVRRMSRLSESLQAESTRVLGVSPNESDAIASHWRGIVLLDRGKANDAIDAFRKAIELDEDFAEPYLGVVRALAVVQPNDKAEVMNAVLKYFSLEPKSPPAIAYIALGSTYAEQGRDEESIQAFEHAIELGSDDAQKRLCFVQIAQALNRKGDFRKAAEIYKNVLEAAPNEATIWTNFAWFLANCPDSEIRDLPKAAQLASHALEEDSSDVSRRLVVGAVHYRNGEYDEAIEILNSNLQPADSNLDASKYMLLLAMSYFEIGDTFAGKEWYERAVKIIEAASGSDGELARFREEASKFLLDVQ